jgi:steroid Delta-isomerase
MTAAQSCARYVELFEHLAPERLAELAPLVTEDVHFRDPFNDVRGVAAFTRVLEDMFERTEAPRFEVLHWTADGHCGYIRWRFSARVPLLGQWRIEGVSTLEFAADGRIAEHLDYWDASAVYARIPLLGALVRGVRRRLACKA